MLTKAKITAIETLKSLSDEQLNAIETLSKNDEQAVLDKRIGEIHGNYDQDIKEVTGKDKPQGVKTYDFMKDVLKGYKETVDGFSTKEQQITDLQTEIKDLKKQIKDGNTDQALKNQLEQAKAELESVQNTFSLEKQKWEANVQQKDQEMNAFKIKSTLREKVGAFSFKPTDIIPEDVRHLTVTNAIDQIMGEYTIQEKDGSLVFLKDGQIERDKDDSLNPIKAEKLLSKKLESIIQKGKPGAGGGGGPAPGKPGEAITIANARTQVEATEAIEKTLLSNGVIKGSSQWTESFDKAYTENKVDALPIQ